jgi:uridine phosphorylase
VKQPFKAEHINATAEDLAGNNGIGRYVFLPGSDGRASQIAKNFDNLSIKPHPRCHNLYLGTIDCNGTPIDVAAIPSGMGCPSMEIILHELFHLGAKRFLRVGTAGSLQPNIVAGDLVNAQASVRDEDTTTHYVPREFPAVASLEFMSSIMLAAEKIKLSSHLHTGIVHCKSAFYAREFGAGPRGDEHKSYLELLSKRGVLASEMETSALFIQSTLFNHELQQMKETPQHRVLSGAILTIMDTAESETSKNSASSDQSIKLAIEAVKILATQELLH